MKASFIFVPVMLTLALTLAVTANASASTTSNFLGWNVAAPVSEKTAGSNYVSCDPADSYRLQSKEKPPPSIPNSSFVGRMNHTLERVLAHFPNGSLKSGLKQYLKVLGLDIYQTDGQVRSGNYGIDMYFSKEVATRPCYGPLAERYYALLNDRPARYDPGRVPFPNMISLDENAGQGRFGYSKPGATWDIAVQMANGDPNLAMALIGVCGNDNIEQMGGFSYFDRSPEALLQRENELKRINTQISENNKTLQKLYSDGKIGTTSAQIFRETQSLRSERKDLLQCTGGMTKQLFCAPAVSGFYAPKSLSANADISNKLKTQIAKVEAPTMGASALPAKYYHVMGAAFMACQLVEHGVSPNIAKTIEEQAGRLYRVVRLCQESRRLLHVRKTLAQSYEQAIKSGKTKAKDWEQFLVNEALARSDMPISGIIATSYYTANKNGMAIEHKGSPLSTILNVPLNDPDVTDSIIRKKTAIAISQMNAAALYKKWYLGGSKIFGKQLPCTDIRIFGPAIINPNSDPFNFVDKYFCGSGMSSSQCDAARQTLQTWQTDEEWTMAQHRIGAEFAATHCKMLKAGQNQFTNACQALKNSQSLAHDQPPIEKDQTKMMPASDLAPEPSTK